MLFARTEEGLCFFKLLQVTVETEFHWWDKLKLGQLKNLERSTGIVVVQQGKARVLETEIDALVNETNYTLDLNTDD